MLGGTIKQISIVPHEESVMMDGREYSVDDWADIEKLRLMYILGTKKKATDYLKILDTLEFYYDYYLYEVENGVDKEEIGVMSIRNVIKSFGFNYKSKFSSNHVSDEQVLDFIRSYSGDNKFIDSLQSYLSSKGYLTPKQIDAARTTVVIHHFLSDKNRLCFFFKDRNMNSPTVKRMISGGCQSIMIDDVVVLWKD